MKKSRQCYAIYLHSRHTGETTYLGSKFESSKEAEAYANREICKRCNSYTIYPTEKNSVWINRHQPLASPAYAKEIRMARMARFKREVVHQFALKRPRRVDDGY